MVCRNKYSVVIVILTTMITTAAALATEAYTTASTWLRAGPDSSFISIERVPEIHWSMFMDVRMVMVGAMLMSTVSVDGFQVVAFNSSIMVAGALHRF